MKRSLITPFLFFVPFALVTTQAHAQLAKLWESRYDAPGSGDDFFYDLEVDAAGNAYATGESAGPNGWFLDSDVVTAKFDGLGNLMWAQSYDGPGAGRDAGFAIALDSQGNVIVCADSLGNGTDSDVAVLKYSPAGQLLWVQRWNGPFNGYDGSQGGRTLAIDGANNIVVGAYAFGAPSGADAVLLKYAPNGTMLWQQLYDGLGNLGDGIFSLTLDPQNNIYATGDTHGLGQSHDVLLVKYSPSGQLLWERAYDGPDNGYDSGYSVVLDVQGSVLVTGFSTSLAGKDDYVTLKYSAAGNLQWASRYDAGSNEIAFRVASDAQGRVAVTGQSENPYGYSSACTTVLYDANGNQLWAQRYDGNPLYYTDEAGADLRFDPTGSLFVVGMTWGGFENGLDALLLEYSPFGNLVWEQRIDGPVHGDEAVYAIELITKGLVVAGDSQSGAPKQDGMVRRYGKPSKLAIVDDSPVSLPAASSAAKGSRSPFLQLRRR